MGLKSHWTGTILFSNFGTQSAKQEISTIGVGSTLGLIFWFGSAFAHCDLWRPSLLQFRLEALWRLQSHIGCLVKFT